MLFRLGKRISYLTGFELKPLTSPPVARGAHYVISYAMSLSTKSLFQVSEEHLLRLFDKYVQNVLDFKKANCTDLVQCAELNSIESLCVLLSALLTEENGVSDYY